VSNRVQLQALVLLFGASLAMPVRSELTCEQLVASAQAGIALRDQGSTLRQVLAETDKPQMRNRFKTEELAMIRRAVQLTFTGEVSLHELAGSCAESKGSPQR